MRDSPVNVRPEAGSRRGVRRDRPGTAPGQGIEPPAWARGGVLYSIHPRAFSREGTFDAIRPHLGRIRALGADAIWLLPIHPVGIRGRKGPLGSPYAVRDYLAVNPEYGTEEEFRRLVDEAHAAGLRVIIDLVANHAALDHPEPAGAWFHRDGRGRRTRRVRGWSDVADWNHQAPGARAHLLSAMEHWVRAFGIDGYRCDVAGMVPAEFWIEARHLLLSAYPDHLLLAEWDDPALHRTAFHVTYDWELYRGLHAAARGRRPAATLADILARRQAHFPAGAEALRFVENHDEPRAARRFGRAARGATLFTALAGGLFLIYNGQESGATRRPGLFNREPIDWNAPGAGAWAAFWRELQDLRGCVRHFGPPQPVDAGGSSGLAVYRRSGPRETLVVALNPGRRFEPLAGEVARLARAQSPCPPSDALTPLCDAPALPPGSAAAWLLDVGP